jgi:hypothetical protein
VESKHDGLLGGEERVEFPVAEAVRMFAGGLEGALSPRERAISSFLTSFFT